MYQSYNLLQPGKEVVDKITAIAGSGNTVFIGTRRGCIFKYIIGSTDDHSASFRLVKLWDNFRKKPIAQIELVIEQNILFVLCDHILTMHDLSSDKLTVLHTLKDRVLLFSISVDRNVSLTNESAVAVFLCVVIDRKLNILFPKNNNLELLPAEINLPAVPKAISFTKNQICVALPREYVLYDYLTLTKTSIFPIAMSQHIDPCIVPMRPDMFGVTQSEFLMAVYPEKMITSAKLTHRRKSLYQSAYDDIDDKYAFKSLICNQPIIKFVWDEPFVVALMRSGDGIEIRTLKNYGIDTDTLVQQFTDLRNIQWLVRTGKGTIVLASETRFWFLERVEEKIQREMFVAARNFHLAIQLTNQSDETVEVKAEKLQYLKTRNAYELFSRSEFTLAMNEFLKLKNDPTEVIRLIPGLLPPDTTIRFDFDRPTLDPESRDFEEALEALCDYLTAVRTELTAIITPEGEMDASTRTMLMIVNTTLLKCYVQVRENMIEYLVRSKPNFCKFRETEIILKKYEKYRELVMFYQTHDKHREALEFLRNNSTRKEISANIHDQTVRYFQYLCAEFLKHKSLILEFIEPLLISKPDDGLKIFTEYAIEEARPDILLYLRTKFKHLVIPFLEHVIMVNNDQHTIFHQTLIRRYVKLLNEMRDGIEKETDSDLKYEKQMACFKTQQKLYMFLVKSKKYSAEEILQEIPLMNYFEERIILYGRLRKHDEVFKICIQVLGTVGRAVHYCDLNVKRQPDIYNRLIGYLLIPPTHPPFENVPLHEKCLRPNLEAVIKIMNTYPKHIDPCVVLPLLPDDVPLVRLKSFINVSLSEQVIQKKSSQVLQGLYQSENIQLEEYLMALESKKIHMTESTVCATCFKPFKERTAFKRRPDGKIVHFIC